jgi:hypothetical protein
VAVAAADQVGPAPAQRQRRPDDAVETPRHRGPT